jgi:hypothetical protein
MPILQALRLVTVCPMLPQGIFTQALFDIHQTDMF